MSLVNYLRAHHLAASIHIHALVFLVLCESGLTWQIVIGSGISRLVEQLRLTDVIIS